MKLLVANRGEIAIRIMRAAAELGIPTVGVFPKDDANSLHTGKCDEPVELSGVGSAAYLDIEQIISVAKKTGCETIHPGYGFLAENAKFVRRCGEEGLVFVGPRVEVLEAFGDKVQARAVAIAAGVPVIRGLDHPVSLKEIHKFFKDLGEGRAIMIKAVAGGGGRGIRVVTKVKELEEAYERCRSEAQTAFGQGDVYVEEFIPRARHIEVQILGDLHGEVIHLGERECSIQRRFQKIIEVAPAPGLPDSLRSQIIEAAVLCARETGYSNAGTFEFLVDVSGNGANQPFAFIEANARLQVEHTVTEEVTGVDIVQAQLRLAQGASIADLGLTGGAEPRGYAIQARICMETIAEDGSVRPSSGTITAYEAPSGPGVRTDGFGYSGYRTSLAFDSLLAKVIGYSPSPNFRDTIARTTRALSEFRIEGVNTNIPFLQSVLAHKDFANARIHTRFVDENIVQLAAGSETTQRRYVRPVANETAAATESKVGARMNSLDPIAVFAHDARVREQESAAGTRTGQEPAGLMGPDGTVGITSPIQGTVIAINVAVGDEIRVGLQVAVLEAMKMEHVIPADRSGIVREILMSVGDVALEGHPIIYIEEAEVEGDVAQLEEEVDPDYIRPDLAEVYERHSYIYDENRPEAVAKRRKRGRRTARENIAHLLDEGSFKEFGPLVIASSWQSTQWLRENTQADGMIMGLGSVNGDLFDDEHSRVAVAHYDYTVVAGTQGGRGHYKQDRLYEMARRFRLPLVLFSEGGGGRPGINGGYSDNGDTGKAKGLTGVVGGGLGINVPTFTELSQLSGLVPMVGVNCGRSFAGNTVLLACCDVIIATQDSTIAMGGPAMIEAGGLGIYRPEEVGPMSFQVPNGVVDIVAKDDADAVGIAKKYLSYFQGTIKHWEAHDQRKMRHIVPENRVRMYNIRDIIETLADKDSVLEIRKDFGVGIITALIRVEGQPMGLIANNVHHLSGAVDSDGADKGARFLQLCDAFDLPVVTLIDCPGIMVGPNHERTALVRHCARLFNTGANLSVPMFGVVVRKAYGLGAQSMCGGSSVFPLLTVAWPTAEFAGMAIEGNVKLSNRRELMAIEDPEERRKAYEEKVARLYEAARGVNVVVGYGIEDVIDPADTRSWIIRGMKSVPPVLSRTEKKRPNIDTW